MKLSSILMKLENIEEYRLLNDSDFETFGLVESKTDKTLCTFIDTEKYINLIPSNVTMVITTEDMASKIKKQGICVVSNPRIFFFNIHNLLKNNLEYVRNNFKTSIGKNCTISKFSCISDKNVIIGNGVTIEEFVSIKENTIIGDNSIIRAGTIVGGTDFEFKRTDNNIVAIEHYGGVIIKENVEVQHNSSICKALYPWDNTIIGYNTKIDDLVQISHGVKVGNNVMIVGQSGIGGRTTVGNNTWIGYSTTIKNGIKIGENCRVNMGSVVTRDVNDFESVTGNFAINHEKFIKFIKNVSK